MRNGYTLATYTPSRYEEDKELVRTIETTFVNFKNFDPEDLRDINEKRRIIREKTGYSRLQVAPNTFLTLFKCTPERIQQFLENEYFRAIKRINKFGDPVTNPQSPFNPKNQNLEIKLKKEEDGQLRMFS